MARGGARPGAGRRKGGHNKLTDESLELAKSTGITPLEYLLKVMQDDGLDEKTRIDAAKAAAPFVHPKLSSVEMNASVDVVSHEDWVTSLK